MDLTLIMGPDQRLLKIEDAQPQEEISDEVVQDIFTEEAITQWVKVHVANGYTVLDFQDDFGNRYVYVLTAYDAQRNIWTMRWPD